MANLNPGGSHKKGGRVFGARNIARHCNQALKARDHGEAAQTSLGDKAHSEGKAAARRRRQMERSGK